MLVRLENDEKQPQNPLEQVPTTTLAHGWGFLDPYATVELPPRIFGAHARPLGLEISPLKWRVYEHFARLGFLIRSAQYGFDFALYESLADHSRFLLRCLDVPEISPLEAAQAVRVSNAVRKSCVFAWIAAGEVEFVQLLYVRQPVDKDLI